MNPVVPFVDPSEKDPFEFDFAMCHGSYFYCSSIHGYVNQRKLVRRQARWFHKPKRRDKRIKITSP